MLKGGGLAEEGKWSGRPLYIGLAEALAAIVEMLKIYNVEKITSWGFQRGCYGQGLLGKKLVEVVGDSDSEE